MGPLGWPETVFIVILALVLFGPKKLPELGRMLGKAITEFRRASTELRSTFEREMRALERETENVKQAAALQDSYNYDHSAYDTGLPYTPEIAPPSITESASVPEGAESAKPVQPFALSPAVGTVAQGSLPENGAHREDPAPSEAAMNLANAPHRPMQDGAQG